MKTTALVIHAPYAAALEEIDVPKPGAGDAVVRIEFSGVSVGTESSVVSGKRIHNGTFPLISGYMAAGVIVEVGCEVSHLKVGDRVVSPGTRTDQAINPVFGGHAAHHVVSARELLPIPEGCDPRVAAMHVLPAVGLNAVTMAGINDSDTVVVSGQGLIGQFFAQWAVARGARVIGVEPDPLRARLARQEAGIEVIDPSACDLACEIETRTSGEWPTVVVDATANPSLIRQTSSLIRRMHARMIFLSWYPDEITLPFAHFHNWEATALFPMGDGGRTAKRAVLNGFARGVIRMGENLTHVVSYEDSAAALERMAKGDRSIQGMVLDWRNCK